MKDKRSLLAYKNIIATIFIKAFNMVVSFAMVSISIKYLGIEQYGIWLTISGVIMWSAMFDFGFAHGLRNRLAEVIAKDDLHNGRYLVSSTYAIVAVIAFVLAITLIPLGLIINWQELLNITPELSKQVTLIVLVTFLLFLLQFLLKPINSILNAFQLSSLPQFFSALSNGIILCIVMFMLNSGSKSFLQYAVVSSIIPVFTTFIVTLTCFIFVYKSLRPQLKCVRLQDVKSVGGLGGKFFLIQLCLLVVYSSDNLLVAYISGPEEVTIYNAVYKYFSIVTVTFGVLMSPFWTAITDAYAKKDYTWISKTINRLLIILLFGSAISLLLVLFSGKIFSMWLGPQIHIPFNLIYLMGVFAVAMAWLNIFSYFSNGIGLVRVQTISYLCSALFNIPLSIYLGKYLGLGSAGVLIATITCISIVALTLTIQYYKLKLGTLSGVWAK